MHFGICGGLDMVPLARKTGYEYIEMSVGGLLQPREPDSVFEATMADVRAAPLPCPVLNCFLPGDLRVTGPEADEAAALDYMKVAFARAEIARVDTIVFGSGGARRVPEGFDHEQAWAQLVALCKKAGPLAQSRGVVIAMEPLNQAECNILVTAAETARFVREVNHPAVQLLVDAYHWAREAEAAAVIAENGDILRHVHIATGANRRIPAAEEWDFAPFFEGLRKAKYDGRISIEAGIAEPEKELPAALELLRSLC